ncbi:MAG: DnaJ domain-containing protein [Oligoflexia bacterium]|nr:DnaJ domain-containing protein [Oligoflexia bacterium]
MSGRNPVNYYFILNVSPTAKTEEIKQAYLKLVKIYHPDKNRGSRLAEKKFQQINSAWEVLKDSHKRKLFDENLRKAKLFKKEPWIQAQSLQTKEGHAKEPKKEKAIDLEYSLKVSLEDLCQSKVKTIHYLKPVNDSQVKSRLKVQIPLGAKPGTRLLFKGEGGSEGKKAFGNLYVKISIKSHKIFKIIDNSSDIMIEQPISFVSAIQSNKVEALSPYGFLSLKVEPPIQHKQVLKVRNYGLSKDSKDKKGDLFIKFFVEYPAENGAKIQQQMLKMPYEKQKIYIEQFKNSSFIYPKVLKFQKKLEELKKEYYPNEKL